MTNMEQALKDAGVKLPSKTERIWNWVKDHPDSTASSVATAIKLEQTTVGTLLTQLAKRKMLAVNKRFNTVGAGRAFVNTYRTQHTSFAEASNKSIPLRWKEKKATTAKTTAEKGQSPNGVADYNKEYAAMNGTKGMNVDFLVDLAMTLPVKDFIEFRRRLDDVLGGKQ